MSRVRFNNADYSRHKVYLSIYLSIYLSQIDTFLEALVLICTNKQRLGLDCFVVASSQPAHLDQISRPKTIDQRIAARAAQQRIVGPSRETNFLFANTKSTIARFCKLFQININTMTRFPIIIFRLIY